MKLTRNPEVQWREEDEPRARAAAGLDKGEDVSEVGTSVLFLDGVMLSLNLLGTEIWKRCDGRSREDIATDLLAIYDAEPERIRQDLAAFLSELREKDFIRCEE